MVPLSLLALSSLALASVGSSQPALPGPTRPADLRIKTYNVNYGLAGDDATLEAIGAGAPDIVLLQETTLAWEEHIRDRYGGAYPHVAFIEGPGAGGMGVLSRLPFETRELLPSPVGWFDAWIVRVDTPQGPLDLLQVHLMPPYAEVGGFVVGAFTTADERLEELSVYLGYLDPEVPAVVAGDFNARGGRVLRAVEDAGFEDALPAGEDTWRWPVAGIELSAPLDHLFVDPRLQAVEARVQDLGRSDHLPLLVGVAW